MRSSSESIPRPRGDARALAQAKELAAAYDELAGEVREWIRARRGSRLRDVHDEDDVAQDVWLRIAFAYRRFDPAQGSLRGWAYRIVQRALLDFLLERARPPASLDDVDPASAGPAPHGEWSEAVLDEVGALERIDRQLLWICGVEGRPSTEAARELALSVAAARKRWLRLRQRLARRPNLAALSR